LATRSILSAKSEEEKKPVGKIPQVDLKAQYLSIKPEIDAAIQRVVDNTSFIMGPEVKGFEEAFARYLGVQGAVGVASGTAALHLALLACGVGPGDEVITTTFTFFATFEAIAQVGATPVVVDIHPDTYNIDPQQVADAITPRTKAIIPVHIYGQSADMDEILALAHQHNLLVIEDAAQAVGAEYRGVRCGGIGDISCFSFFPSKNLGCYGDGGAVAGNRPELIERVRKLRDHGRINKYEHAELGWGYRLDALQAAILGAKLPHLDDWTAARRVVADRYNSLLADTEIVTPAERPYNKHVYHTYVVRTPRRDEVLATLAKDGIGVGIHYPIPLHLQPAYRSMGLPERSLPVSEAACGQILTLPTYPELTMEQQERVADALKAIVG
jgi:dTDP-4-amino-4,6-dideoxygalactose transaminase